MKLKFISIFFTFIAIISTSCRKIDNLPLLESTSIEIYNDSIICSSKVLASIAEVTENGFCWNSNGNPTISENKINTGKGIGSFKATIKKSGPNSEVYIRSYALNNNGISYGDILKIPNVTIETNEITNITKNSARCGVQVLNDGGIPVLYKGICWSHSDNPTLKDNVLKQSGISGTNIFEISQLENNTKYFVRAFLINSNGVVYGNLKSFKTFSLVPTLTTNTPYSILFNEANCGGSILNQGETPILNKGLCWSTNQDPTISDNISVDGTGNGVLNFYTNIRNLTPNTTYYVRAYATNSNGTGYGENVIFKTLSSEPGTLYKGGAIAYVFQQGDLGFVIGQTHGIIVALNDQAVSVDYGCWNYVSSLNDQIGSGRTNTESIVGTCGNNGVAALCSNLVLNSCSDWYLPSILELEQIFLNIKKIHYANNSNGSGWTTLTGQYWSSSDAGIYGSNYAPTYDFSAGQLNRAVFKSELNRVRAIRYF